VFKSAWLVDMGFKAAVDEFWPFEEHEAELARGTGRRPMPGGRRW
jgi:hypothetical protein